MGKKSSGSSDRKSQSAKAGKRHGHITYPPARTSAERQAARDQGEQQFVAKNQLTVEREIPWIVYDKALKSFVSSTKKITLPADHVFDLKRGRLVNSPSRFKEANK